MNLRWIQYILLYCVACAGTPSHAYRTGDAVDTDVVMDGFLWDALRSQMPKFAISTKVYFEMDNIPDDQQRRYTTFALLFEDGLRSIETRPYQKTTSSWQRGGGESQVLDRVVVTFSYSKSAGRTMSGNNGGMIHSVSSTAVYKAGDSHVGSSSSSSSNRRFRVEYEWQEEEAVRLTVGSVVMFMAVFLSSIVFLFQTCGLTNDGDDDYYENSSESMMTVMHDEYHPGSSSPSPYSDHYHKKW